MAEHRVPLLGDRWRRFDDPETSHDPQVRALVGQLQGLEAGPGPDPAFRTELRAQLVAIAPRLVADGIADETAMVDILPTKEADAPGTPAHAPAIRRFRPARVLTVAATMVVAFALLLGGAVVLSKKAIPGDTLYGLKRASERFELATDGSDAKRANDLLRFASTRTGEVQQLIGRANATASGAGPHAGGMSASTAALITSTLASANSDTADASRLLATQAIHDGSATPLTSMTNWAPGQLARLKAIWAALPSGSLRSATASSAELVSSAQNRARQLITTVTCACASTAPTDKLGPKPCAVCPNSTAGPANSSHGASKPTTSRGKATQVPVGGASPVVPVPGKPVTLPTIPPLNQVSPPTTPKPTSGVPPIVPPLSSLLPTKPPVTVKSCGVSVNLLGIKVNLGTCPPSP